MAGVFLDYIADGENIMQSATRIGIFAMKNTITNVVTMSARCSLAHERVSNQRQPSAKPDKIFITASLERVE